MMHLQDNVITIDARRPENMSAEEYSQSASLLLRFLQIAYESQLMELESLEASNKKYEEVYLSLPIRTSLSELNIYGIYGIP
jgi:hypothetical protein